MRAWLLILAIATACGPDPADLPADGPTQPGPPDAGPPDARVIADAWVFADAPPPYERASVYSHSYFELFELDPDTLDVTLVGPFVWPTSVGEDMMTDLALDDAGNMIGISWGNVYSVDKETAVCTYLSTMDRSFNGLSFVSAPGPDPGADILVGASLDGMLYQIDPLTGASTQIGPMGYESSGDLVSVRGFGTVATVLAGGYGDHIASVEVTTGAATLIGGTGVPDIWGLGFWGGQLYGFTADNKVLQIDPTTAAATQLSVGPSNWTGAGVTTSAPIEP